MKQAPAFYAKSPDRVLALQKADLESLAPIFSEAREAWLAEWRRQGATDEGTCCGGKGIRVWYVGPRKRIAKRLLVVESPGCQGNLSASRSSRPALEILRASHIECQYYDGWMD